MARASGPRAAGAHGADYSACGAARDLQAFERVGDHVFSTTKGVKPISGTTLSGWAAELVGDAVEGGQAPARGGIKDVARALLTAQSP